MRATCLVAVVACLGAVACNKKDTGTSPSPASGPSFFVTSSTSVTGNFGGLRGADNRCQTLATAVGLGHKTWRAYLSVERDPDNGNRPTDARSRIGSGPWTNVNGVTVAR